MCMPFVYISFKFNGLFCINDISHLKVITLDSSKLHSLFSSNSSVILPQNGRYDVYVLYFVCATAISARCNLLFNKKNIQLSTCTTAEVHFKYT